MIPAASQSTQALSQLAAIHTTVTELQKVQPPPEERELPYVVPEAARPLLTQLKHQLLDLIVTTLNEAGTEADRPDLLSVKLADELKSRGVELGWKGIPESQLLGRIYQVKIQRSAGHPELLAATTDLQIPCGDDSSLYLFKRNGAQWRLILAIEANDYSQVNGAFGDFQFGVSRSDAHGNWFVVAAHLSPWCTSCWNGINYQVVQPRPDPYSPRVISQGTRDMVYRCVDGDPFKLIVGTEDFQLTYTGDMPLDMGILQRPHIDHYRIIAEGLRRLPPLADEPQRFLDEWIDLSWDDAVRWSDSAKAAEMKQWHDRLRRVNDEKTYNQFAYEPSIDFIQPCNKPPSQWQIGLSIDSGKRVDRLPDQLFFTITKHKNEFYLQRIDTTRPSGCPGETPPVN